MTEINKDNLYLLLPGIIAGVARIYAEENGCGNIEAVRRVYSSGLYPRLADESTLLIMDVVVKLSDGSIVNLEIQKLGYMFPGERSACV